VSEYFLIAKITSVHDKEGYLKTEIYSDYPERFEKLKTVFIDFWGDKKKFIVEKVKKHKNSFLIKFLNFYSERETGILVGREIYIDEKLKVELPENNYFVHDLIGSTVLLNDENVGIVKDVINTPANDVLLLNDKDGKEILVPFVLAYIDAIDSETKLIKLKDLDLTPDDED
jgi:16S rRNA processing protein RimM